MEQRESAKRQVGLYRGGNSAPQKEQGKIDILIFTPEIYLLDIGHSNLSTGSVCRRS